MATITASLERSLQKCSLNRQRSRGGENGIRRSPSSSSSSSDDNNLPNGVSETTLELNSHLSLPCYWEQCLDLKTGEIYYINWRNGMRAKEDPRTTEEYSGDFYSEDEDDETSYVSEESSSESSPSRDRDRHYSDGRWVEKEKEKENVLVVAGCKSCFMYFMVPKRVEDCPKCTGQLLHFDRPENGSL
ncbi:hypothetical protein SLA2020_216960 [Shorea laevis]